MSKCHCSKWLVQNAQGAIDVARIVANQMGHDDVWMTENGHSSYILRFETNTSWFKVENVAELRQDKLSFDLILLSGSDVVWSQDFHKVTLSEFNNTMKHRFENGFPAEGGAFLWTSTACERNPIEMENDCWKPTPDPAKGVENSCADAGSDDTNADEEEATEYCLDRMPGFYQPGIVGVVPDGIKKVRVVALKYSGEVIAFRFKTNLGSFDIRREAAARYGLGAFKTETFITLKSVGGLLMSDSERKKGICVPDVSSCREDCDKLMNAVFGK